MYILIDEVTNKLSENQKTEGVVYEIDSIFSEENKIESKFYSQREGAMD